ncbi:hypothetical protein PRZ48_009021 [Zasmidium cellare]|uniref:Methyltransferase domain-containing protein n=1 Tax=Zasmidium cellare TaxID=395010 RepID=A0ABR0EH72_ZASCE|nr:hypothetical protein PRZ48_009021 [Zasmidium cellare]
MTTATEPQPHYHALNKTPFTTRTAQSNARHLLPYIQPNHRILDIGCGPGSITADLAELVPQGEVVGIDINPDFVEAGIALAKERGLQNLFFRVGDVTTDLANIEPSTFDIVHAHQVLLHLPDPLSTMQQMRRIAKPGGLISSVDSAFKLIIPSNPGILSSEATYEKLSKGNPTFGQTSHITAHAAGFS